MTTFVNMYRNTIGQVGEIPGQVWLYSDATREQFETAGFLNNAEKFSQVTISQSDFINARLSDNELVIAQPSFASNGVITAVIIADSSVPTPPTNNWPYEGAMWVASNGLDTNGGLSINEPKLTIQAAITALSSGGVINIVDEGIYTEDLVFPTGQNYFINCPGATLAADTGPHFTANGSVIVINAGIISSNGKEVLSVTNNPTFFITALNSFGNYTRTNGFLSLNVSEIGGDFATSSNGDTIIKFRTLTGDVADTSGAGSNRVGLYGETLTGNVSSTNTKVYGEVVNVTGTLAGVLFGNFGPSTAGDGTQSGTFIGGGLSINDSKILNEIYTVETITGAKSIRLVDGNKLFLYNSGSDNNFTLPQYSTDPTIPLGFRFWIVQASTGFAGILGEGSDVILFTGTLATTAGEGTKIEIELVIKAASGNSFVNTWAVNGNVYGGGP